MDSIKPHALRRGDTIGIFTPSWPGHCSQRPKFDYAIEQLHALGFKTKLGSVTQLFEREGYRAASGQRRAQEFMELIEDPDVNAVLSTLGGAVSNSLIEHLNFEKIARAKKPIIGHSDLTSLLWGIHSRTGLVVFYGPMLVPNFGEKPRPLEMTMDSLFAAVGDSETANRKLEVPEEWSDENFEASDPRWQKGERNYKPSPGWKVLSEGEARGRSLAANVSTLCHNLGTPSIPPLKGHILFLEQLEMELQSEERQLSQLKLAGVFDEIAGLVISKPEILSLSGAPFSAEDLYREIIGKRAYPIVWGFDCGHTHPTHTIPLGIETKITALNPNKVEIHLCEPSVTEGTRSYLRTRRTSGRY